MGQRVNDALFVLLRSAMSGSPLSNEERSAVSADLFDELFALSKEHDMAHLVAVALSNNGLLEKGSPGSEKFTSSMYQAVLRYEQTNYELDRLCKILEQAQIPFIPLKGSVIRRLYPEPWMRTSCDIDILVHESDVEKAAEYLVENCGYEKERLESHDISLFSPNHVHLELHYDLIEDYLFEARAEVLKNVWDVSILREGYSFWREMIDDMFFFYHVAHMAKHFEGGGCGLRPFIDLWLLDRQTNVDKTKRDRLLEQGGLLKFANTARRLSEAWLGGAEHTQTTRQVEEYILSGGVYGNTENRVAVQQNKKGGKIKYIVSKIFPTYETMKFFYPILQKHKRLLPIMHLRRWMRIVFFGTTKQTQYELKYNANISAKQQESMASFLKDIGLDR